MSGTQHEGPWSEWSGASVNFMLEAAKEAKFSMEIVKPPDYLVNQTYDALGSKSIYNQCVHAATLGLLDVCIFQATITTRRALAAIVLPMNIEQVYLVFAPESNQESQFKSDLLTVFAPFEPQTWIFIIFFVIPVLGLVTLVHEYGNPTFPKKDQIVIVDETGREVETERKYPLWKHAVRSIYLTLLATFKGDYSVSVVSHGAFINTLATSFFIVVVLSTYTANLASFFTIKAAQPVVTNMDEAISSGWRFCMQRARVSQTQVFYPALQDDFIVKDPPELGGDGEPGFSCKECKGRERVFKMVDAEKADQDPRYCHAAVGFLSDLQTMQAKGEVCHLESIFLVNGANTGLAVSPLVSTELSSLILKMTNEGKYQRVLEDSEPKSRCAAFGRRSDLTSIKIADLTGMWVVTFGLATIGLLVSLVEHCRRKKRKKPVVVLKRHVFDQSMQKVSFYSNDDGSWQNESNDPLSSKNIQAVIQQVRCYDQEHERQKVHNEKIKFENESISNEHEETVTPLKD